MNKYNLTAIAAATMAVGMAGDALAKNGGPSEPFPEVEGLICAYAHDAEDAYAYGEYAIFAAWHDSIGAGEAGGATEYAGEANIEALYFAECESEAFIGDAEFPEQVTVGLDLGAAEVDCEGGGGYCGAIWEGFDVDNETAIMDAAWDAANSACLAAGEGYAVAVHFDTLSTSSGSGGPDDVEVSLKHIDPGKGSARQDHPVVTKDCTDFTFLMP